MTEPLTVQYRVDNVRGNMVRWIQKKIMQEHSQDFQELLKNVEATLIQAGQNACKLAEQTGTELIVRDVPHAGGNELQKAEKYNI